METLVFPHVEDLGTVVIDLRARVEALEAAQQPHQDKAVPLVGRVADVLEDNYYWYLDRKVAEDEARAAIREVAVWLCTEYRGSSAEEWAAVLLEEAVS